MAANGAGGGRRPAARIAIDPQLRSGFVARLAREVGPEKVLPLAGFDVVLAVRGRKDEHELALLRRANELTQQAIAAIAPHLRSGMDGGEIGAWIDRAHGRLGLDGPWNLALIGAAAAVPHGETRDVRLARGDVLLVDTGGGFHGYQSDISRTWVFDAAPGVEVERAWNTVRDAQQRAFDALRPGLVCAEADRIARARIAEAGYGAGYTALTHRLGHGIGLEGHEDPYFDGGSEVVLASGMTLSNEPGIYLVGHFGVRLEDIVAITEQGAEHFGRWQSSPRSPA
jgi:Xaa-Pro dipeptidase